MTIRQEIERALSATIISTEELSVDTIRIIREEIALKYAYNRSNAALGDCIMGAYTVHSATIWQNLTEIIPIVPVIMFFEEGYEDCGFIFDTVDDLVTTLAESYHFVFYLTDPQTQYILCYNDHDMLIAGGLAAPWLEAYCTA